MGLDYYGMSKNGAGFMTLACVERTADVLSHAAVGRSEGVESIPVAIATGARPQVGSEKACQIAMNVRYDELVDLGIAPSGG